MALQRQLAPLVWELLSEVEALSLDASTAAQTGVVDRQAARICMFAGGAGSAPTGRLPVLSMVGKELSSHHKQHHKQLSILCLPLSL